MSEAKIKVTNEAQLPGIFFSMRFLLILSLFFGLAILDSQKIDMGLGVVCMLNHTAVNEIKNTLSQEFSFNAENQACHSRTKTFLHERDGPFIYTKDQQIYILSSYFYGNILVQIPGGWLSYKIGGKRVMGISLLLGSIITLLVPIAARFSYFSILVCRVLTGIFHGSCKPAVSSILTYWTPDSENTRLIGFSHAASSLGDFTAMIAGSYLCIYGFDGGWPSIFYTFGCAGIIWFCFFMILTTDSPKTHKYISSSELNYILESTSQRTDNNIQKAPWLAILGSKACIAIFISHFCYNWSMFFFLTELPSFMNDILLFDIETSGIFSTLPYLACWIIACFGAYMSDIIINYKIMTRKSARKLFNILGLFFGSVSMILLSLVTCTSPYMAVGFLTVGYGFMGLCIGAGFLVNINEVGGKFSSVVFGISNTFGCLAGIILPYFVGVVTKNKRTDEWQFVFMTSALIYFIGAAVYLFLAEVDTNEWKKEDEN